MNAIDRAIKRIHNRLGNAELPEILKQFYREYTAETLVAVAELDEQENIENFKIGGTC